MLVCTDTNSTAAFGIYWTPMTIQLPFYCTRAYYQGIGKRPQACLSVLFAALWQHLRPKGPGVQCYTSKEDSNPGQKVWTDSFFKF